jgi:hypothetical protein
MPFQSVKDEMHKFKQGELHSGSSKGKIVTNRKQAIAISLSEARKAGVDVSPSKKRKKKR